MRAEAALEDTGQGSSLRWVRISLQSSTGSLFDRPVAATRPNDQLTRPRCTPSGLMGRKVRSAAMGSSFGIGAIVCGGAVAWQAGVDQAETAGSARANTRIGSGQWGDSRARSSELIRIGWSENSRLSAASRPARFTDPSSATPRRDEGAHRGG